MKRKVVKQGHSTLMVSLPTEWTKKFDIKKGDDIEVSIQDKVLLISTDKPLSIKEIEIDLDDLHGMIMRVMAAIYKAGYEKLKITYKDPNRIIDIQNASRTDLSGFEIIEQGKNYCVVKKVEEGIKDGFEPILRRIFQLQLTMADESLDAIKQRQYGDLARLRMLEGTNNRLTTYCQRNLSKQGYKEHNKIQYIYLIIENLELIADQYKHMFDYLLKPQNSKLKISEDTLRSYKDVNTIIRLYYELFYNFDKSKIVKIGRMRKKLVKNTEDSIMNKPREELVIMHYLLFITTYIFESIEPYVALVL